MKAWLRSFLLAAGIALSLIPSSLAQVMTLTLTSPANESSVAVVGASVIPATSIVVGNWYRIETVGTAPTNTVYTLLGSPDSAIGTVFKATAAGATVAGTTGTVVDLAASGSVVLTARATGTAGFKTTFFVNGSAVSKAIPNDVSGDASTVWTPPQPGVYFITASASDDFGNSATALARRIFATGTIVTSPVSNTLVPVGSSVVIKADATPAAGFVKQIEFFVGGTSLGAADTNAPYSIIYTPPGPAGTTYNITARATDNSNTLMGPSAAVAIKMVEPIGSLPTCKIVSPAEGKPRAIPDYSKDATAHIPVEVAASDNDGQITKVEIYIDGVLVSTDNLYPYQYNWQPPSRGKYRLSALAFDDKNNVKWSGDNEVTVSSPPTIGFDKPGANATLTAGTTVTFEVAVFDPDDPTGLGGVKSVEISAEEEALPVTKISATKYSASWKPKVKSDGTQTIITAVATDADDVANTARIGVFVAPGSGSGGGSASYVGTPPSVTVTAPGAASVFRVGTPIMIQADAQDPDPFFVHKPGDTPEAVGEIRSVQFFVNGASIGTDTTYPYNVTWTPTSLGTGFTITAKAEDNRGNVVESTAVIVSVNDPSASLPVVSITDPASGMMSIGETRNITASATDADGIAGVQFFVNGKTLGGLIASYPFTVPWKPSSPGTYALTARAFDTFGNQADTAAAVTMIVVAGAVPTVSITSPANNSNVVVNVPRTIDVTASVAGGAIASVRFFVDGSPLSEDSAYPYSASWTPTATGVYNLTAVAIDTLGNIATSSRVSVTAITGAAPTVTIVNPNGGGTYIAGKEILFDATATDSDGTIARVDFLTNGSVVASDSNSPYYTNWTPASPGTYTMVARAIDNSGNIANSAPITITVVQNTPPNITLHSPASGASYTLGSPVVFFADAVDANGSINHVRFLANGDLIGSNVTTAPYTTIWKPGFTGAYTVLAIAVDNDLNASTSPTRTVTIMPPVGSPPTIAITSPLSSTALTTASTYPIIAGAVDPDGAVVSVSFYDNGSLLGVVGAAPFALNWRPDKAGTHRLVAVATDSGGNIVSSDPVDLVATAGASAPPTVSITNPVGGSSLPANVAVLINAGASDPDGSVVSVQFLANNVALATDNSFPYAYTWTPAGPGRYTLIAVATDNTGNQTASTPIVVDVTGAGSPTVSITSPATNTTVPVNTTQTLIATASSTAGSIVSVEFIANNASVGTANAFPYTVDWKPASPGAYQVTAVATDSFGNKLTSAPIAVSVTAGTAPTISVTNPVNGASIVVGTPILIQSNAADADGTVTKVDFLLNGAPFASDSTYPFAAEWKPETAGTFVVTAVATDNMGNKVTSSQVSVTVTGGTAPTVSITAPSAGDVPVNVLQQISVNAASSTGTIALVQFYVNGTALPSDNTFPFTAEWTPTSIGTAVLTAMATDNLGNQTVSAPIAVTVVPSAPPQVSVTQPVSGSAYSVGTKLTVTAEASDPDGVVQSVQFYVNGVALDADLTAPYSATWTPGSAGVFLVTAIATDNSGNRTTSAASTVTIGANAAPTVALTNPQPGLSYSLGNALVISAKAADADGTVSGVRFFANGKEIGSVSAMPYVVNWMPTVAGTYVISAQATDDNGNVATTPGTSITVTGAPAPVVVLTNPSQGAAYGVDTPITLNATASGGNGAISQVQFFVNGSPLGTADKVAPYSIAWTPSAAGSYSVTAVATDSVGLSSTSSALSVNILANTPPMVALTNPTSSVRVSAGSILTLAANASDVDGTIMSVRFLANGYLVGAVMAAPYSLSWKPSAAGIYQVTAEALDNSGNVAASLSVQATVIANQSPTVALTTPSSGFSTRVGTGVTLRATAADADGTVAKVDFVANGVVVGSDTTAPYQFAWTPGAEGLYRLTAIATDNTGTATVSSQVSVLVSGTGVDSSDQIYTGSYQSASEFGRCALISVRGKGGVFMGWSSTLPARAYFLQGIVPDAAGGIRILDTKGATALDLRMSDTGVSGTLATAAGGNAFVIGQVSLSGVSTLPVGLWTGSVAGRSASSVYGILDHAGGLALALVEGASAEVGSTTVLANGSFTLTTTAGTRVQGRLDPLTGFLTATLTGGAGGSLAAAPASGPSFSDGVLRNLSTRGQVGTGSKIMTAGFVVAGGTPKRVLLRAIGPTLGNYGLSSGLLANPMLRLYRGSNELASNDDWSGDPLVAAAQASVGAFALPAASKDAVLLTTLEPGSYTAQVSGVGGTSGIALVELYDLDSLDPYSPQKLVNVSTSGEVGAADRALFAGFMVNGQASKKVLIRGIGPALASFGVAGALADPVLVLRSGTTIVRENDNWEVGNESTLVVDASLKTGAFALPAGSKDAALLLNLPPGIYSAELRSAGSATGIAMVEVYEVP